MPDLISNPPDWAVLLTVVAALYAAISEAHDNWEDVPFWRRTYILAFVALAVWWIIRHT